MQLNIQTLAKFKFSLPKFRIKMFLRASELKVVGTILMETRKIKSTLKKKN